MRSTSWALFVWAVLALSMKVSSASTLDVPEGNEKVEVPVGNIFVPPSGYDDNDHVQIVLDGVLRNGCYSAADPEVSIDPVAHQITARLFAYHRTDATCADEQHLPNSLLAPVPYTLDVSVGTLPEGDFRILYPRPGLVEGIRDFHVSHAKTTAIDDYPYAAVSSVWIQDTVRGDENIEAHLIGSFTNGCSYMADIAVKLLKDVFVVLPKLAFRPNLMCPFMMQPFDRTISLGNPGEGRYLIHVRSMNGHSVNRAFSAVVPDPQMLRAK